MDFWPWFQQFHLKLGYTSDSDSTWWRGSGQDLLYSGVLIYCLLRGWRIFWNTFPNLFLYNSHLEERLGTFLRLVPERAFSVVQVINQGRIVNSRQNGKGMQDKGCRPVTASLGVSSVEQSGICF